MPEGVTTGTQSLPPWLEVILRNLAEQSQRVAQEPYSSYPHPRSVPYEHVPETLESENMIRHGVNTYGPYAQRALSNFQEAERTIPSNIQHYMNPYMENVVNQISTLGNRNFTENILPALEGHFTSLGQHGSSRHADLSQRAARDVQEGIRRDQGQALFQGYDQATNLSAIDRQRALQAAQIASGLGRQHQGNIFGSAAALRGIGEARQEHAQHERDIGYENWLRQQAYPGQQLAEHGARLHGHPHSTQSSSYNVQAPPPGPPRTNTAGRIGELAGTFLGARKTGLFKEGGEVHSLSSLVATKHRKSAQIPQKKTYFGIQGLKFNTNSPKVGHHSSRKGRL